MSQAPEKDEAPEITEVPEISLAELRFEPEQGRIWLKDYRMVMLSACALGALRKELIETLGRDHARGLMKRFGYAAGLADGLALAELFPTASEDCHMDFGPALHALEGMARVVRIPERTEIDLAQGRYHVEAYWRNSFEAEQHLELFGASQEPVCWTLAGYALGHSSAIAGRPTVVVETECRAMGHENCRFTAALADEIPDMHRREQPDYSPQHLPKTLRDLLDTLKQQKKKLRSKEKTIVQLRSEVDRARRPGRFIGNSEVLSKAIETARTAAPYTSTVLIQGESGTGKELMARFVHEQSLRAGQAMVAINCSALPENLEEAELFGYARGAFTGAVSATAGVFEAAHGGTLFLDEIGDLSLTAQTKILRALQEGQIKRLGETRTRKVDARIVAATNQDLGNLVREKRFREDLYYRLSVIPLTLPPLRHRGNDVLLLAEHFLDVYGHRFSKTLAGLSRDAACALAGYTWPGNVRELENVMERAVILAEGQQVELEDLPGHVVAGTPLTVDRGATVSEDHPRPSSVHSTLLTIEDETERLRKALKMAHGNRRHAAELLGISRTTLWRKMKKSMDVPIS